ncbi:hypothetical protein JY611_14225 [Staphylococcus aureus]|uniref:hypothetical protein n=1 Tax=Staphylococcus aureus TaxID=1280 RepID=UPI001EE5921C|nr:hypothetical protein [Staphylococcus aureus]MBN5680633.1 hypothetical protein [Staphylococcus aureus]MCG5138588.1 hypothetical protein [Staphylococcus aureus]WIZ17876.1 hypothetical protein PCM25_01240 [Staphylococcus aureus]WJC41199.1 hypothetical protein PCL79_01240 [Staphylococcus aureus]
MENQKQGNGLKIATWVFIVLTVVTPLFGIGSIVCSINYKKYDVEKGSKLLQIAIIVTIIAFVLNLLAYLGLR